MTTTLRVVLAIGILFYFVVVISLLKRKQLALRYTLIWLLMGVVMAIMVAFPKLLDLIRQAFGFMDAMNALFVFALGFAFVLLMAMTSIVSKQAEKIKDLIQVNALLEKRIRELENEKK